MQYMQKERKKYSVVIPVHNEEKYLAAALDSLVRQSLPAFQIMIVDDNSTDRSAELINEYTNRYPFIQSVSSGSTSTSHEPGNKIIHAFYKGFHQLDSGWDIIAKLDADVILSEDYFEKVVSAFEADPKVGIAGGVGYILKDGEWIYEEVGSYVRVRGAFTSYSKECFQKIGGLRKSVGWDTVDDLLTLYYGFKIHVMRDLPVKLQKPTGKVYKSIVGIKRGQAYYRMRYGYLISLVSALKISKNFGNPAIFFSIFKGYFQSALKSDKRIVSKEEGRFIRKYRWQNALKKINLFE